MIDARPGGGDATVPQDAALALPVWDLPIRIFHWALVALIAFSWWSAETHRLQWHIYSGLTALFAILFRLAWGLVGSSTARFASFVRGPRELMHYLGDPKGWSGIGHSPLGALSVIALLGLVGAQIGFGLFLVDEEGEYSGPLAHWVDDQTSELARTVHLTLFNVLLAFIALHVAAILFYRLRRGKRLLSPMLRGTATDLPAGTSGLVAARPGRLLACLAVAAALTGWIVAGSPLP
jgi:cytochrome b